MQGLVQVFGLAALSAIGAELLTAYADGTGDFGATLFALVFFMALYGAPALLARELARRAGWGWPSLLLLCAALGVAQACVIDQSLFAEHYGGYEGWEEARQATFLPALGVSAGNVHNFIVGHVVFSFGAPIAVAEAWRPDRARTAWLSPLGMGFAALAYLGAALLILLDPQSHSASPIQLAASVAVVAGCIALAWVIGRRSAGSEGPRMGAGRRLGWISVLVVAFVLATAANLAGEGWLGFAVGVSATALIAALAGWGGGRPAWSIRHAAAVGMGFLLSRGVLAFTYYPLAGEVGAVAKYTHNVVMLGLVLAAGGFALSRRGTSDLGVRAGAHGSGEGRPS
ncbi:hypothetical protein CSW64_10975 [Caulobacter mirabilis]|uniref:Uncharacterized protein n=1 Tax=Caulobacter mirabilis TaxID=69666 RepID=A0A2D2B3W4_9CAUL|nr:hypothetical protein CSW64_10975 [Caulobacter mirabilis]